MSKRAPRIWASPLVINASIAAGLAIALLAQGAAMRALAWLLLCVPPAVIVVKTGPGGKPGG